MNYHIVVFDIGKTNKKIAIFSSDLKFISKESTQIRDALIDGILCDRIPELNAWVLDRLKSISKRYRIGVISTTTYGATIACIGNSGELVFPVISYMHEPGEEIRKKFYSTLGSAQDLYLKTATPLFGQLLSVGMQLFWLKTKRRAEFKKVIDILFLPQYEGYVLTGKKAVELTSIGCHTYLYDFHGKSWSDVAKKLGVTKRFPKKFSNPWDILGKINPDISNCTGLPEECRVSVGIHDSNASLLPYLLAKKGKFVLASTGTWGVFMFNHQTSSRLRRTGGSSFYLSPEDMRKDTLYYIDAFGRPARSASFAMGQEHDHYSDMIEKKFSIEPRKLKPDKNLIKKIINSKSCFVTPTLTKGSGQFPNSKPRIINKEEFFRDAKSAYTLLNLSLAIQSYFAIRQALGHEANQNIPIYVEGGFRNNTIYLNILSTLFPNQNVVATNIQEATSLGAAICGKCAAEGIQPEDIDPRLIKISEKPIKNLDIDQKLIQQYISEFEEHCSSL
ncbi:hypothetical protein AUJ66_00900 [Candidatus Desantisbacteria bacterium CG1_02_38_46]|uniref:Uncharacterized protein n=3 Tax=unclassified Candidatus Desantisiibacteriota TaxID=3106372 RepID=A0A2H9P9N4_9BACT|nr:MAG: hypothetical protein AUJ66_00900 [Candidatus Desantisbacteria bacterium CG1_02_38_46]PIU51490.1 MAG: hypothetical protein COS91_04225 [Candidatus Desantisbacteria bacterium CG07_land_8_20_14_0_80_39_15]PIZ14958.1 MAG: hypothetical protein COY51_06870 [Candidatus Desantisbacteria bacterium CG_4_10_14_0_8_um_filter_39_17]